MNQTSPNSSATQPEVLDPGRNAGDLGPDPHRHRGVPGGDWRRLGDWLGTELARPAVGAAVAGAGLILAAASAGLAEAVVGGLGALAIYRFLKKRRKASLGSNESPST